MTNNVHRAKGHDRESYEYSLRNLHVPKGGSPSAAASERKGTFIVQLAGPLHSPARVQEAAALDRAPALVKGVGENGESQFCEIDTAAKANLQKWVSAHHAGFQPTIVRLSKAKKELCRHSLAPMLGKECVLPQHRADEADFRPSPSADQYPVWYFFYGTLADPDVLSRHLGLEKSAQYLEAETVGGRIHTWAGKYKALVDAPGEIVSGSAFKVESREQEDTLRFYETDHYEVVRCQIATRLGVLDGLTFRFDGEEKDLD